jgi:putative membrane protein
MMMTTILSAVQATPTYAWGHAGWGWWFPFGLIFWLGLTALVVYLVMHVTRRQPSEAKSARDILAERFARGEISPEEYEERLSHLS